MKKTSDIFFLIVSLLQLIYGISCLITKNPVSPVSFVCVAAFAVCCCVEDVVQGGADR